MGRYASSGQPKRVGGESAAKAIELRRSVEDGRCLSDGTSHFHGNGEFTELREKLSTCGGRVFPRRKGADWTDYRCIRHLAAMERDRETNGERQRDG